MPRFGDQNPDLDSGSGGGGLSFIPYINLKENKESCVFRILSERPDFVHEEFHCQFDGKKFTSYELCASALKKECRLCSDKEDRISRTGTRFFGWVQEKYHDYVDEDSIPNWVDSDDVEEKQVGKRTVFRVQVNEPKLLNYAYTHFNPFQEQWDEEDTLTDRDFKWTRTGEPKDMKTSYSLRPGAIEKLPKALRDILKDLPDIQEVALGLVTSLGDDDEEEEKPKKKVKKGKKAKKADPEPEDGDEDDDEVEDPFENEAALDAEDDEDEDDDDI